MTITRLIVEIKDPVIRVPLWSLWFPVVFIAFVVRALFHPQGRGRLLKAECWSFIAAIYISGIDGW